MDIKALPFDPKAGGNDNYPVYFVFRYLIVNVIEQGTHEAQGGTSAVEVPYYKLIVWDEIRGDHELTINPLNNPQHWQQYHVENGHYVKGFVGPHAGEYMGQLFFLGCWSGYDFFH